MIRVIVFLAAAGFIALGVVWLADRPGQIAITWLGYRADTSSQYYTARSGHRVHRPMQAARIPAGASAQCRDGSWSFSESRRGTCSWHGGVARWL